MRNISTKRIALISLNTHIMIYWEKKLSFHIKKNQFKGLFYN